MSRAILFGVAMIVGACVIHLSPSQSPTRLADSGANGPSDSRQQNEPQRESPSREEIDLAPIGDSPKLEGAISTATPLLLDLLNDPESARISWSDRLSRDWYRPNLFSGADDSAQIGWVLTASVNAKNSFGGYTGSKPWVAIFRDGHLVAIGESWTLYEFAVRESPGEARAEDGWRLVLIRELADPIPVPN